MRRGIALFAVFFAGCSLLYEPEPTPLPGAADAGERAEMLPDGSASFGTLPDAAQNSPDAALNSPDAALNSPDAAPSSPDAALPDASDPDVVDAAAPPDADPNCPAECTGGCFASNCNVSCQFAGSCNDTFVCPTGFSCSFECTGNGSCNGDFVCPEGVACIFDCEAPSSCVLTTCGPSNLCIADCAPEACGL